MDKRGRGGSDNLERFGSFLGGVWESFGFWIVRFLLLGFGFLHSLEIGILKA